MKVVLDSNVIIAAFAAQGLCHLVFESVLSNHSLIIGKGLLFEIEENLKKKIKLPPGRVKEIIHLLVNNAEVVKDIPAPDIHCRDKSDIMVLSLAVHSHADAIVTGDQDLLVLKSIESTVILTPREFWSMLKTR